MKYVKSQSGQALVEYILILVVVVGLILGGIYQLNSAFKLWANAYFGDYLTCLMEAGELPGLGAPDPNSECKELFREFNIADGEPLVGDGISEGGESNSGGGSGSTTAAPSGNSDARSSAFSRGGANRFGGSSRFRANRGGGGDDEGDGIEREGSTSGGGIGTGGFSNESGGRPKRFALRDTDGSRRRGRALKEKEDVEKKSKAKNIEKGDGQRSGPKLLRITRRTASVGEAPELDDIGFGGYLRYIIIAAIIIAVVIFLGGQILQVSKSME